MTRKTDDEVKALVEAHGHHKILLVYEDRQGEGVWATCASAEDAAIYKNDESYGEKYKAVLCNQPLGWAGKRWGEVITATTQGDNRPQALESENGGAVVEDEDEDDEEGGDDE